jgi:hypothetical protein
MSLSGSGWRMVLYIDVQDYMVVVLIRSGDSKERFGVGFC